MVDARPRTGGAGCDRGCDEGCSGGYAEDDRLVQRTLRGDLEAYDALFRCHYRRIYNLALRLDGGGDHDQAEDIAQTAFVRAYQSLAHLRDGRAFVKFLYRVTVNLVRDRARAMRRRPWVALFDLRAAATVRSDRSDGGAPDAGPVEIADGRGDPACIVLGRRRQDALVRAIDGLPPEFREPLLLHHMECLEVREIARILGVPEGTVKSRLGRARGRLREALSAWEEEEP